MRVCDGIPTLQEVAVVAALTQCLVHQFDTQLDRGYSLPVPRSWLVRENKWRAARFGLDASIIVDEQGTTVPLRTAIEELIDDLTPIAKRLHCSNELLSVGDVIRRGPSSVRQREIVDAGGSLRDVVDSLVHELREDQPSAAPVHAAAG
jgi:carboxylate-amine ligase